MHVSARLDYGVRALLELAQRDGQTVKADAIAQAQGIPLKFLEAILRDLKLAGMVTSQRGASGGFRLAQPSAEISVADIARALDGPLAAVRGERPEAVRYPGAAESLTKVWIALRVSMRDVLEEISLENILTGQLPDAINDLLTHPGAWQRR